jgi:hypothetical protein
MHFSTLKIEQKFSIAVFGINQIIDLVRKGCYNRHEPGMIGMEGTKNDKSIGI